MSHDGLLSAFFVGAAPTFITRTQGVAIIDPCPRYGSSDDTLTLTNFNFRQLIDIVQSLVDWSTQAKEEIRHLTATVATLSAENANLKEECGELRVACTAVTETEINRLKQSFGQCISDPDRVLSSLFNPGEQ